MVYLPTFLSFPWSFPSLPPISLPANIQRRFLSYVLKRTLGRYVKSGGLDVDRIQAQISEGWVEIEGLEVDEGEINSLIPPSIPLSLSSGTLSKVTARIPFPNLWSAPLSITLDTLTLDFTLSSPNAKGKAPGTPHRARPNTQQSPGLDLTASVTIAADEFLHDELDAYQEAELDRSIRESLVLSQTDPFVSDNLPGSFPPIGPQASGAHEASGSVPLSPGVESTTVLAGIIERVLARLDLKVRNIKIRLHHLDPAHGGVFELRVKEIQYIDETAPQEGGPTATVRALKISGVEVFTLSTSSAPSRPGMARLSSSSSTVSTSTIESESDGNGDMAMSLAVADLRQSMAASSIAGESVYESALSEQEEEAPRRSPRMDMKRSLERMSRSETPRAMEVEEVEPELLLSFGSEDVVIRMITTRPTPPLSATGTPTAPPNGTLPSVEIAASVGTISCLFTPSKLGSILSAIQAGTAGQPSDAASASQPTQTIQPRLAFRLKVEHIFAAAIYDVDPISSIELDQGIKRFWSSPGATYLPVGHLKLRIDTIDTSYTFPGTTPATRPSQPRTRSKSTSMAPNPVLSLSITDISLFEFLASAQTDSGATPGGIFPVLLFDPGLKKQYELPPGPTSSPSTDGGLAGIGTSESTFPGYDTFDWRDVNYQRKGSSEKLWKVKPKGRGALKNAPGTVLEDTGPVVTVRKELIETGSASVHLKPLHIFLDLSLIERLLPMLRYIAPAMRRSRSTASSPIATTPLTPRAPRSLHSVIDDLEAPQRSTPEQAKAELAVISCAVLRLDVRCPAPPAKRGTWGDASSLRSGIVTLDIHSLTALVGVGGQARLPTPRQGKVENLGRVDCQKAILFFCRAPEKRSSAFFVVGPLGTEPGDLPSDVLLPSIDVSSSIVRGSKTQLVVCRVPCVQSQIHQSTIEGLQFFADDITHWLDGAFGDGSRPSPRDELKMIGSRFFGSKGSSSASSSAMEELGDELPGATVLHVVVSEFDTRLHVPRSSSSLDPGVHAADQRILSLRASDIDSKIESNTSGRQETGFTISILDAEFSDRSDLAHSKRMFGRTTPPTLTIPTPPLVHVHFYTLTDPTGTKESGLKLSLSSGTAYIFDDLAWARDLAAFAKTPEGVFEDVVPSEITRINILLNDTSVHLKAPKEIGAVVLVLASGVYRTDLVSGADEGVIEVGMTGKVLAVDDVAAVGALHGGHASSFEAWRLAGWAPLVECMFDARVFRDLTGTQGVLLDVIQSHVKVTACADSLATVGELVTDIGTIFARPPAPQNVAQPPIGLDQSIDVFASVDEEAFHRMPELTSGVDMIEDDLPTNLDYLDETTARPPKRSPTRGDTDSDLVASALESSILEVSRPQDAATIKIFMDEPFEPETNYWNDLPVVSGADNEDTAVGKIRVQVQDASVSIYLHEGYDWHKTRKVIEDEIKAVRRKLEKIRQLLASGQKADEPSVQGHSVLFNSVYIGLDERQEDLDSAALLAAIDEELDGLATADTASQSSWQTDFPPAQAQARRDKGRTRLRGKRLTRSKKPQIEISLEGIKVDLDVFSPDAPTASRVGITVGSMEILDHIKTSTWKKFLTEMKSDGRGNMRETGADMVRVELTAVRPSLATGRGGRAAAGPDGKQTGSGVVGEESRLKAKILPLRLHVDQDALDFFKRFFSFSKDKNPAQTAPSSDAGPFLQHVEIFAIELKLDYKPKRVDLAALREGRTIELMNFFHFDGAEMTLRHVTLSGITGWNRLSTTLQDIWTPDVKANQLADVISGVSPIRSLVNVGSGVADLILLPIEQYRKDGRVTRGVQRGTSSFVRSTAMEMMKLGARLATGTQVVLEKAEGALGGGKLPEIEVSQQLPTRRDDLESDDDSTAGDDAGSGNKTSRYANQPLGAKEGVQAAYQSLSRNVNAAAQTILAVPMEVYERSGPGEDGPLKAVVRAVPIAVLKPMIGASEAVSKTLLGVRNSLDPQSKRDLGDKYK